MLSRALIPVLMLVAACSTADDATDGGSPAGGAAETTAPQNASAAVDPANPLAYDDADCNLSTVLKPGVPGSPGNLIQSQRNPNGDSELAVMMRRFVTDLQEARTQAQGGGKVPAMFEVHRMMRCAWPTNPKERDEGYDMRAQAYLFAVRQFEALPSQGTYNAIVANCIACHQASCGGVIPFIETLKW